MNFKNRNFGEERFLGGWHTDSEDDFSVCLYQGLVLLSVPTDQERDQHDLWFTCLHHYNMGRSNPRRLKSSKSKVRMKT